jgi:hypothetical protein
MQAIGEKRHKSMRLQIRLHNNTLKVIIVLVPEKPKQTQKEVIKW